VLARASYPKSPVFPTSNDVKKRTCWRLWLLPERWWGSQSPCGAGSSPLERHPNSDAQNPHNLFPAVS